MKQVEMIRHYVLVLFSLDDQFASLPIQLTKTIKIF